jgi:DNA-binding NtrC family response regulator
MPSLAPILIVEDEPQLRLLLAERLEQSGIRSIQAGDGVEAMAVLQDNPAVPLLLSDIRMPNMNGHELVEAALRLRPELKVLMMTAYVEEQPQAAALRAREIRTMVKPFDPDRLAGLVLDMLARP